VAGEVSRGRGDGVGRSARAAVGWLACAAIVLGATVWFSQASWANAQTSTIATTAAGHSGFSEIAQAQFDALPPLRTTTNEAVQVGRPLEVIAYVHELDGTPVKSASVLFEWDSKSGRKFLRGTTDFRGVASVHRWIGRSERGYMNRIRVSVDTVNWRAERYAWFVPE
jgi:hypothetical protein